MSFSADQETSSDGIDLLPVQQLVAFWRDRAERIRDQSPTMDIRAEVFETCAAQLADALASIDWVGPEPRDSASLELFGGEPVTDEESV
ncbi:MAG TPA: hypothetical protein VFI91_13505 [Longimicrobiaceae bacterium]|nr:hypothetical protein [Longimicrobiaceae bacterium]